MARSTQQRWLFTLGVLAVLLLITGVILSTGPAAQMRLVRQIRSSGGLVGIEPPNHGGWLGRITRSLPEAFGEVHSVNIADMPVRRHWLVAMRNFKHLNQVWLNRTG